LAFTFAQGAFGVHLNRLFYTYHGPFYDSVSYLRQLAEVIHVTQTAGFFAGLKTAGTISTVFLPFGFVPFFASFVSPDRAIGVWLLAPWVLLCAGTFAFYLMRHRGAAPLLAAALAILLVSLHACYFWVGGISDFRMDLPFSLLFTATVLWLVLALRGDGLRSWAIFGTIAGFTCLSRATAPVFLTLTCVPMVLPELFAGRQRLVAVLKGVALGVGVCVLLSGWFFALNWKYLHYYYFIWNLDANARLPLAASVQHLRFAADSVGPVVFAAAGLCTLLALADRFATGRAAGGTLRSWLGEVEWRFAAPALVPVGYLVISGAGPNGLVSLPSAFGFVLLLLALPGRWPERRWRAALIAGIAFAAAGWSAHAGIRLHRIGPGTANPASAYAAVTRAIEEQAATLPGPDIHVAHFGLGDYHNVALAGYLIYDRRLPGHGGRVRLGDRTIHLQGSTVFEQATRVEWNALPGANDEQRINHIAATINREADLLVLPTEATAEQLAVRSPGNHINLFAARIRRRLLETGRWEQVSPVFRASHWEEDYTVMRNTAR
jgi:hypothetical protein